MIKKNAELFLANHPTSLWEGVLAPWFEKAGQTSWRQGRPTVVIVPSRSHGIYLKSRLLEKGKGFAGISFWTPREARLFLLQQFPSPFPIIYRENLRLLLSIAAGHFPDSPVARAVERDPAGMADSLDLLASAGWGMSEFGMIFSKDLAKIIGGFHGILAETKLQSVQQNDQWLESSFVSASHFPVFESLLVTGFDGIHWHLWPFLRALVMASQKATIGLKAPQMPAEKLDQAWIGSWEEFLGDAKPVPDPHDPIPQPFGIFSNLPELEKKVTGPKSADLLIRIGKNIREQSEAIVSQALHFLSEKSCARLGILLPGYGALSREVSDGLSRLKIPHYDTLAHSGPPLSGGAAWKSWLAFQKNPGLQNLFAFLQACPRAAALSPLSLRKTRKILKKASEEMLVENLRVLAVFLQKSHGEEERGIGILLDAFQLLPDRATLREFGELTRKQVETFGLDMDFRILEELAPRLSASFSRNIFLGWLGENSGMTGKVRDPMGNHPYSRVQLLPYSEADPQAWSHLILAGLNEGEWPPRLEESGFLGEKQIAQLNDRALKMGSQGEGHWTARPGKGLCVGTAEKRAMIQAKFYSLLESVQVGLCLTASLFNEANPGLQQVPGDFLSRLYLAENGKPLDGTEMKRLQEETAEWVVSSRIPENFQEVSPPLSTPLEQTRLAYDARRDAASPFGEFEFALKTPPPRPLALPCKKWEQALESPAMVWMQGLLGVEPGESAKNEDPFGLIVGSWVHRWISRGIMGKENPREFVGFPNVTTLLDAMKREAEETRDWAMKIFEEAGCPPPDWWLGVWKKARWMAGNLTEAAGGITGFPWAIAEMKIPEGAGFSCANGDRLELSGRVDLLLMETRGSFEEGRAWVIDFKTGGDPSITLNNFKNGKGVQPALYVLALHSLGARQVSASIVRPEEPMGPQVELAEILEFRPFWEELARMQQTGIFGMRGELRPEFGFRADYPLATLEIDGEIIDRKWELTHSGFGEVENED